MGVLINTVIKIVYGHVPFNRSFGSQQVKDHTPQRLVSFYGENSYVIEQESGKIEIHYKRARVYFKDQIKDRLFCMWLASKGYKLI